MHEDIAAYKKATFYSALYCHLFLNLHVVLFGQAPISIRNLGCDMPTQFSDYASLGMTIRGGGAEGAESTVWHRRVIQARLTSLLMLGKGMVPVEREARMLKEKLRFMTWKMQRLPALLPSVMGWEKRQLREVKRVQREQAGMSVMELPPVGFQKPKGELAEYGVSSSDAAALMAAAVEEAGDVDKKIGNMATAASAVHFGPRAWYLLHRQGLGEDQDNRQRRHVDGREGQ